MYSICRFISTGADSQHQPMRMVYVASHTTAIAPLRVCGSLQTDGLIGSYTRTNARMSNDLGHIRSAIVW